MDEMSHGLRSFHSLGGRSAKILSFSLRRGADAHWLHVAGAAEETDLFGVFCKWTYPSLEYWSTNTVARSYLDVVSRPVIWAINPLVSDFI